MEVKFYKCSACGNLLIPAIDGGVTPECCGMEMDELQAGVTDAAVEKHVPVIVRNPDGIHIDINVGSVEHPMTADHFIEVIVLLLDKRIYIFNLSAGDEPTVLCGYKDNTVPMKAYAYCNLHGLWASTEG
ncbi:MAG: desulfoferrodoxin Dfx [Clostridiales bacterium]|nr:desulfoferrodoxin Dfx [Clostridiales bacterium]